MQTLGVSDSAPKSEGRIKSLLWPSIQSGSDVDYLGIQGYWVCTLVAAMTLIVGLFFTLAQAIDATQAIMVLLFFGVLSLFFYIGGVGVREGSRFAAVIVFVVYVLGTLTALLSSPVSGGSLIKLAVSAVLLSNLRATWIAARWVPGAEESALPPRRSATLGDKFVDQVPRWLWPKIRIPYYLLSALVLLLVLLSDAAMLFKPSVR
jgi:hypothetical protein